VNKFINVIVLTLAANFLAVAGGVVYLHQTGRLDREKVLAIRELLYPPPAPEQPTTQPAEPATTQPILRLERLLAQHAGRPAGEQVEFIQRSFDAQMAQLDRRQRELADLQRQIDLAKQQMERDRSAIEKADAELVARADEVQRLANDKGFQDSLALYNTMQSKQVKAVFVTLDDATIVRYLQNMQPRVASRIIKEFKTPEEVLRIKGILEQMSSGAAASAKE
jgi:hypothetical protein